MNVTPDFEWQNDPLAHVTVLLEIAETIHDSADSAAYYQQQAIGVALLDLSRTMRRIEDRLQTVSLSQTPPEAGVLRHRLGECPHSHGASEPWSPPFPMGGRHQ